MKRRHATILCLLFPLVAASTCRAGEPVVVPAAEFQALLSAYALVKTRYVEAPDDKKLLEGAIAGMLASLDPHSGFLDKDELDAVRKDEAGEYTGIGISVDFAAADMVVTAVTADSPAYLAGIEPGDTIASIDGATLSGMRLPEIARRMRGVPGSALDIGYRRGGSGAVRTARLHRAALLAQTVTARAMPNGIAWIQVSAFEGRTAHDLVAALKTLDPSGAPRGIVLDVRNDPGGLVSAAVGVAGAFLPPGTPLFSARGRATAADPDSAATVTVDPRFYQRPDEPDVLADLPAWARTVPLAVLVNGASASSAELLAGALQDHGRATVLGSRTFGKGSIQSIFPLTGDSAVKLTVARYFTPNGHEIQARGITPDVIVAQDRAQAGARGLALREEDLAQHLTAILPVQDDAPPATRAGVESTRMFGTRDDKVLAAAVSLLGPGQTSRIGNVLGALSPSLKQLGAALKRW
ncbi:carboxyl-terminal processing protease [Massilia aurea]|uniref:Carboxyl-terminal processing protease n=1 Tax=Massilia aurea TaxID=373040 RepID=A0A7W9X1E3_9BURK|nr:S41 family peptidase [Massilia aurea]MBB6134709.1 carboxyl-terminal processing protease [Massilia aurea]